MGKEKIRTDLLKWLQMINDERYMDYEYPHAECDKLVSALLKAYGENEIAEEYERACETKFWYA